ncbi:hypothetical protein BKA82DRAFT_19910 [Pisolithus tinctorius]|uniref:Uncharacterized protein n=1 Tax=Pisolithus tinctorius Marx 270 TaxID=870435 RepID=A0A0C3PTM4_PISTI|nr:hypothetical protein BKA82DRAFT_19910 [Pisolithus tinctorius]KIO12079.1 hypothetical protein M404DRAFT_19910 [Pisolithus tinctorius Marx 270]
MDVRTANLSYLSMIIQYIGVRFRQFTYALQQANNPSNQLPDDWYQQVQVETVTYIEAGPGYLQHIWDNHEGPTCCQ